MDDTVKHLAEKTLLSEADIKMWIEHLKTMKIRRKEGARKAVETKRKKMAEKKKGIRLSSLPNTASVGTHDFKLVTVASAFSIPPFKSLH